MASSQRSITTSVPLWGEGSDSDASSSEDEHGDTSEEEDNVVCLSDEEDDAIFAQRALGERNLQHIPYPQKQKSIVAPDGTTWSNLPPQTTSRTVLRPWQPQSTGFRRDIPEVMAATSPEDIFKLMFDDPTLQVIVQWTNVRGQEVTRSWNSRHPDDHPKRWKDMDAVEIRAVIGLLLLAAIERGGKLPTRTLWTSDERYKRHPFVATMGRDRFRELLRCIRFDNKQDRELRRQQDRLAAIREVFDGVVTKFGRIYIPGKDLTVDEMLIKFRGHFFARVYMKSKPGKYGIKVWAVADSQTRYVANMEIYCGSETDVQKARRAEEYGKLVSVPTSIMLRLLRSYFNTGRTVTADNFFGSKEAAEELMQHRLSSVFTIRKAKREIPKEFLVHRGRQLHSSDFYYSGDCMIVDYKSKPNRVVLAMSTQHSDPLVQSSGARKPQVILYYNKNKGGIDTVDHMISTCSVQRYSRRWPMKVFFHLIDVAAINCYVIWMEKNPTWERSNLGRRRLFLQILGEGLIMPEIERRSFVGLHRDIQYSIRIMTGREPEPIEAPEESDRRPCVECRSRTRVVCDSCRRPVCPRHRMLVCEDCSAR